MDGDSGSRDKDGRGAGLKSLPMLPQPTGAPAGLGCLVFGKEDGEAQCSAEPRLALHRETESGQGVPWVSQLQPLHRAGVPQIKAAQRPQILGERPVFGPG